MMKFFLFFMLFIFNSFIVFANEYTISIRDIDISVDGKNQFISVEFEYNMKNTGNESVFFYDMHIKNQYHYEKDLYSDNLFFKRIYVFKPLDKNSWTGSWGYNPGYPKFVKINPNQIYSGSFNLEFTIPYDVDPYKIDYKFNFVLATCDIGEYLENFDPNEITEKYLYNETVKFRLKWFHREFFMKFMKLLKNFD